jgi:hypothetical protein
MNLAVGFIVLSHIVTLVIQTILGPDHMGDPWPDHAKNHLVQSLFWVVGFNVVAIMIALTSFKKRENWAWWALLASGTFIFAPFFISPLFANGAGSGKIVEVIYITNWILYVVALLSVRKDMKK